MGYEEEKDKEGNVILSISQAVGENIGITLMGNF